MRRGSPWLTPSSRSATCRARSATSSRSTTSTSKSPRARSRCCSAPTAPGRRRRSASSPGAMPADGGELRIFGVDPVTDGESVRRRCGVVPARPALYDRLSGYENLRYAALLWDVDDVDGAIHTAADPLRDRRRARATRRRLLDRHEGTPRARPGDAARARPAAPRRADRGPRPRVGARGARAHRRDGARRPHRAHVHAPPARSRGPRRPRRRDGPRPHARVGLAARARARACGTRSPSRSTPKIPRSSIASAPCPASSRTNA